MTALIFGISGQDGYYLRKLCERKGISVIGVSRSKGDWLQGDVADFGFVTELIKRNMPDYIFHLAANSTTSHEALWDNHAAISTGSFNILEGVKKFSAKTKVFLSGSGLQFENNGLPIVESSPFVASNPYVVSRNHSVYAARYYRSLGFKIYVGYFFNHDSPHRPIRHIAQKIVHYCNTISQQSGKLEIGDIKTKKEFSFAGDIAEAILTLISNDLIYEAVLGSGKAYSIEDWLNICFGYYNLDWKESVHKALDFRKEYDILVSDPSTIFSLGWKPKVDIYALAKMMIEN